MWILIVEAMAALGALLFIVWWTLGPTARRERQSLEAAQRRAASKAATKDEPRS